MLQYFFRPSHIFMIGWWRSLSLFFMENLLAEVGIVIIAAGAIGVIGFYLKQPLVLAYILAGILIGPYALGFVKDTKFLYIVADIGIMLMLFLIGLEMNVSRVKHLGFVPIVIGLGQVVITGLLTFLIVYFFGFSPIETAYIVVAMTMSSTVIAVKILSERQEINSLYGQIVVGILLVQDMIAMFALLVLASFKDGQVSFDYLHFGGIILQALIMAVITVVVANKLLRHVFNRIATSMELLILLSLSWCFIIAMVSHSIGFSMQIGAFIAGLSLANLPYTFEIISKSNVLRNFFVTIFFVSMGASMKFGSVGPLLIPLIVLIIYVLIGNPVIVMTIMGALGYRKRISFFSGLAIANISEFSLLLVALGNGLGHINDSVYSMVTIIGITTMATSSYMITYNNTLYHSLSKFLTIFEMGRHHFRQRRDIKKISDHIILLGCGKMGEEILEQIISFKDAYIVVDHDNEVIQRLTQRGIPCIFGDIEDEDLLNELQIDHAELVISTLPNSSDHYFLLKEVQKLDKKKRPIFVAVANSGREGLELFEKGVDYVIVKPYLAATQMHQVNQELYDLEDEVFEDVLKRHQEKIEKNDHSDHDYARIIAQLSKLRLQEIKESLKEKHQMLRKKNAGKAKRK